MTNRILKINSEIQKELSKLISYKLEDPRLDGVFVSVLDVDTSPDLSHAKIKLSIFPDSKKVGQETCVNNGCYPAQPIKSLPFLGA